MVTFPSSCCCWCYVLRVLHSLLHHHQAFDAAGRQPGAFIAQAVVDVAAMLQKGSLNTSAALVNRKGIGTVQPFAPAP